MSSVKAKTATFNWKLAGFSFIIALPIIIISAKGFLSTRFNRLVDIYSTHDTVISAVRDSPFVDRRFITPEDATAARLFWLHSTGSYYPPREGLAIRLLQNTSLFENVFPGYPPSMAQDDKLWGLYFQRGWDSMTYLSSLEQITDRGFWIQVSSMGCVDIYKAYGADVIVIGNSEVTSQIVPDILSQTLKLPGGIKNPRVLACALGGMFPPVLSIFGDLFSKAKNGKVPVVIWGYSFFTAYTSSPKIKEFNLEMTDIMHSYSETPKTTMNQNQSVAVTLKQTLKFNPTWNDLFPDALTFNRLKENWRVAIKSEAREGEEVRVEDAKTESELEATIARQVKPGYHMLVGVTEKDCDMTQASKDFDKVIKAFLPIAQKVYVYLSPVTARQILAVPKCFYENVTKMLESKKTANVIVRNDRMDGYGLNYYDFMYPTYYPEIIRLEISHVNFRGALKVTKSLSSWVNQSSLSHKGMAVR